MSGVNPEGMPVRKVLKTGLKIIYDANVCNKKGLYDCKKLGDIPFP